MRLTASGEASSKFLAERLPKDKIQARISTDAPTKKDLEDVAREFTLLVSGEALCAHSAFACFNIRPAVRLLTDKIKSIPPNAPQQPKIQIELNRRLFEEAYPDILKAHVVTAPAIDQFGKYIRAVIVLIVLALDMFAFIDFADRLTVIFWGDKAWPPTGAIYYLLILGLIPFTILTTISRRQKFRAADPSQRRGITELDVNTTCLCLMYYFISTVVFAIKIYPYIPAAKGGGSFVEAPRVIVHLKEETTNDMSTLAFRRWNKRYSLFLRTRLPLSSWQIQWRREARKIGSAWKSCRRYWRSTVNKLARSNTCINNISRLKKRGADVGSSFEAGKLDFSCKNEPR